MITVFMDLDGVIVNFQDGICEALKLPTPYLQEENHGKYDMAELFGLTQAQFNKPLKYHFWLSLEKMPDAKPLMNLAKSLGKVYFLSATCVGTHGAYDGKRAWVKRHYPNYSLICTEAEAKQAMAHGAAYLFDDRESNVDEFTARGGRGILVPRPWNRLHAKGWDVPTMLQNIREQIAR